MEPKKPVRKYSRARRLWQYGKYLAHCIAVVPLLVGIGWLIVFSVIAACFSGLAILFALNYDTDMATRLVWLCLTLALSGFVCVLVRAVAQSGKHFGKEGFFRPKLPDENPILPDRDLLVRASGQDSQTQKQELLRAAQESQETPPEELLRVAE